MWRRVDGGGRRVTEMMCVSVNMPYLHQWLIPAVNEESFKEEVRSSNRSMFVDLGRWRRQWEKESHTEKGG